MIFKKKNWTKWMLAGHSHFGTGDDHLLFCRENLDSGEWEYKAVKCKGLTNGTRQVYDFIQEKKKGTP